MEELIKEHYNLIDRMAIKLEEICNEQFGAILQKYNLHRFTGNIQFEDDFYWLDGEIRDWFTKSSDEETINQMTKSKKEELAEEIEVAFYNIFEALLVPQQAIDLMLDEMKINYNKRGDYNFIIKNK